ncbi:MAG TPA: sigma-70 family RNA polymerase sigma factor [Candidatus Saccharimonadales bacterium]|nr:sigma-70 family RNA polymerase sigma factor [Candidatus Saccharimonadales bacterium]
MEIADMYDAHVDKVFKFFYIKSFDKALAEDLTSQTFMALCEIMSDPDYAIQDHKKFLYGIMRNQWLMHLRHKYQRPELALEGIEDFEDYVDEEIEDYAGLTVKQRAEVYINQLPDKQRAVVSRRLLEETSIRDIAADIGKDTNYVKTTYKRGLKRMKELVQAAEPAVSAETVLTAGKEAI